MIPEKLGESNLTISEYIDFYLEEVPDIFETDTPNNLSMREKIERLQLKGMSSHGDKENQHFVVEFTLGYDQLLCVNFDSDLIPKSIIWES